MVRLVDKEVMRSEIAQVKRGTGHHSSVLTQLGYQASETDELRDFHIFDGTEECDPYVPQV